MTAVVTVLLAGVSAALLAPAGAPPAPFGPEAGTTRGGGRAAGATGLRALLTLCTAALPFVVLGGVLGLTAAAAAGTLTWRAWGRVEPAHARRRREALERALPHVVDLLAAALAAGMSPERALARVADAVEDPVAAELRRVEGALALGKDPTRVWQEVAGHPQLAPLGRCLQRATRSGAPVAEAMHRLADDLRRAAREESEGRARSVGVRAAAPLALCLLPAFVLVGVVPLVAGFASSLGATP